MRTTTSQLTREAVLGSGTVIGGGGGGERGERSRRRVLGSRNLHLHWERKGKSRRIRERIKRVNRYVNGGMGRRRSRRRGLSGRRDRGGALAVRELAGEAMDNYEDQIDRMTIRKEEKKR